MTTSKEWLQKVINDNSYLIHWLQRQYIGEVTAAKRIDGLTIKYDIPKKFHPVIQKIAQDEITHANWVGNLLRARNIELPSIEHGEDRYWKPILSEIQSFDDVAAAGAHAEAMRLDRIIVLAESDEIDADIRETFKKILKDEQFHAAAFKAMTSDEAYDKMSAYHNAGLELLGLEI